MSKRYETPVTTVDDGPMDGTTTTHPCFAQIRAARVSGSSFLYGSDFDHNHYVTIAISRSQLKRSLSRDWYFERDELIGVALSEAQWATFVSSMNQGSGVPCTLQHANRERVPQLPQAEKLKSKFDGELKERLGIVEAELAKLREQIMASPLSGKKKDALISTLEGAKRNLTPNLKFVSDQFGEHMENTIEKAKIEVEAYVNSAVVRAGVAALNGEQVLSLGDGKRAEGEQA